MNQINLREAPMVDKPAEGATLFALNPDGSVNRISAANVGGGKIAKLVLDMGNANGVSLQNVMSGVQTLASDGNEEDSSTTFTVTCDNMTFDEAKAIVLAGDKLDAMLYVGHDIYLLPIIFGAQNLMTLASEGSQTESVGWVFLMLGVYLMVSWTADGITAQMIRI